jgi:multidrug resistance efflux pump
MSDPKELEDKLEQIRAGIEKARADIEDAGNALQKARPYLRDLLAGERPDTNPDARIRSVWKALDRVEKDLQRLNRLRLKLFQELSRLSG